MGFSSHANDKGADVMSSSSDTKADAYTLPGKNVIGLGPELADEFKLHFDQQREGAIQLCLLAAAVRNEYLDEKGRRYTAAFEKWWKAHSLDGLFKNRNNFAKYAEAGDAIEKVEARFRTKRSQLPVSMSALYEIAKLSDDELVLCLEHTYSRKEITEVDPKNWKGGKTKPLIHPSVTASEIKNWREKWRNPPKKKDEKRTVQLLEISIHGSIYNVDANGLQTGKIKAEEIQNAVTMISAIFSGKDETILVKSNLDKILEGIEKRKKQAAAHAAKQADADKKPKSAKALKEAAKKK